MKILTLLTAASVLLITANSVPAQGRSAYLNFETPVVKPIAVANVDGDSFVLVCNTPDNSVEVYDVNDIEGATATSGFASVTAVARIPVGLEPVSLAFHPFADLAGEPRNMLYVANWLSDSVTFVELRSDGTDFFFQIVREVPITDATAEHSPIDANGAGTPQLFRWDDEPMHIAVVDRLLGDEPFQVVVVTKRTASSYSQLAAWTGAPARVSDVSGTFVTGGGANVIMTSHGQFPLTRAPLTGNDDTSSSVVKQPHTVLLNPKTTETELWVLGHQGGMGPDFDLDLWSVRLAGTGAPFVQTLGGLGTTNFNMTFDEVGDFLYVVGTEAQNAGVGNAALLTNATGFVKTMLYKVDTSGVNVAFVDRRDINETTAGAAVPGNESLAHATDVQYYGGITGRDLVCVTGFNGDRFAVVDVTSNTGSSWTIEGVDIPFFDSTGTEDTSPEALAGPRAVAIFDRGGGAADRAYVLNRLNNTVAVIQLVDVLGAPRPSVTKTFALDRDPVPNYVRRGQRFLYNTEFSGSKFVSCASCHVDARSDQQSWMLTPERVTQGLPPFFKTNPAFNRAALEVGVSPPSAYHALVDDGMPNGVGEPTELNAKGPKVTQSLQGLVNFEVGGTLFGQISSNPFDDLISNAPYHWRGDKESFRHFNEAFVNLQDDDPNMNANPFGGLTTSQMAQYEEFVNSIHYPPNPLQPRSRRFSGLFEGEGQTSVPDELNDPATGTGGKRGLKLFHIVPTPELGMNQNLFVNRSCVQCHFFPEASNNRITEINSGQPIETAALRGMAQKEGRLHLHTAVPPTCPTPVTPALRSGDIGMGNEGGTGLSRTEFVELITNTATCGVPANGTGTPDEVSAMNQFMLEIDHGVAPMVGFTVTALTSSSRPQVETDVSSMEAQANVANCGLAVYARLTDGSETGFWFEILATGGSAYREVLPGSQVVVLSNLLDDLFVNGVYDLLVFRATPLGSNRRAASLTGIADQAPGASTPPSNVQIVGTTPNTANAEIPGMTVNWDGSANWVGLMLSDGTMLDEPLSLRATRAFQQALASIQVNVTHDAPRRLQVTGDDLAPGARIRIKLPHLSGKIGMPPPQFKRIVLPIYPTEKVTSGGNQIWETAIEFDPIGLYILLLGGPLDAGVKCVMNDTQGRSPAQLNTACNLKDPTTVTYRLDAKNAATGWVNMGQERILYPTVP